MTARVPPQPSYRAATKEEVRRLLARRYTQEQIAAALDISQPAVSKWKKKIEADAADAAADRGTEIRAALDSLAEVEREAWLAWERTKRPAVESRRERGSGPDGPIRKAQRVTKYQAGDPAFLQVILGCQTQRRALLGLDAPTKAQQFVMDELKAGLERLRANLPEALFAQVAGLLAGDAGGVLPAA